MKRLALAKTIIPVIACCVAVIAIASISLNTTRRLSVTIENTGVITIPDKQQSYDEVSKTTYTEIDEQHLTTNKQKNESTNFTSSSNNTEKQTEITASTTNEVLTSENTTERTTEKTSTSNVDGVASHNSSKTKEKIQNDEIDWLEYNGRQYIYDRFAGTAINGKKKEPDMLLGNTTDFVGSYKNRNIKGKVYSINVVDLSDELMVIFDNGSMEILIAM